MPLSKRQTLTQYLIEQRRRFPDASGELNSLILDVALACKAIARAVAFGELGDMFAWLNHTSGDTNVQGEVQKTLDVVSNEMFVRTTEWSGHLAGMASEEMEEPYQIPDRYSRGKYLLVPVDLEEAAFNMLQRNTNNDRFFIQQQGIEVVPVPEWTDTNDWVLAADPAVSAGIEVGFFNGRQEPEIVVADAPTSGSLFTHDKIDLKIRHIYGGAVDDYRPLYKAVVA